jgi:hypothetical protein
MRPGPEHHSRFRVPLLAATLLLARALAAHAQAPSCAWGDGVSLDGAPYRKLLLASDGGAGVFVVTCPVNWFDKPDPPTPPRVGTLRLQHILEQGVLDPALPDTGAVFYSPPDPTDYQGTDAVRAMPDGAGGLYVLTRACNPVLAHIRCWEHSVLRLLHVTAAGTTSPGWPAGGVTIPAEPEPYAIDQGDMVTDGAGGVVVVWMNYDPQAYLTPSVRALRYSASGTPLWPGGDAGVELLAPALERHGIRVAGDGAGGAAVVVSGLTATGRYDLFASRVLPDGSLPWGTAGKAVMNQPTCSASIQGAVMDANGFVFVSAFLTPVVGGASLAATQLLTTTGARHWGAFGITLGVTYWTWIPVACPSGGYVSMHRDGAGAIRIQQQDSFGEPLWGSLPDNADGMVASWTNGVSPIGPILAPDGLWTSCWSDPGPGYLGPPSVIHAQELDAAGEIAAGWPAAGFTVCGGAYGLALDDAISSVGHLFVAFGNEDEYPATAPRVQRLTRAVLDVAPSLPTHPLELSPPSPNPSQGAWTVRFALREAADVTLEAFDIAGRRALQRDLGAFAPGAHVVSADGGKLAPGVYRIRLRAGSHTAERVLVRLR